VVDVLAAQILQLIIKTFWGHFAFIRTVFTEIIVVFIFSITEKRKKKVAIRCVMQKGSKQEKKECKILHVSQRDMLFRDENPHRPKAASASTATRVHAII
jgi:hypothetical protein